MSTVAKNRGHALLTKALEKKLEKSPIYKWDGKQAEAPVIVKFFSSSFTWYITEGEKIEDGWTFFGLFVNEATGERELGYFDFNELNDLPNPGLRMMPAVERDCWFGTHKLGEFLKSSPTAEESEFNSAS